MFVAVVSAVVDVMVDVFVPSVNTRVFLSRTTGYRRLYASDSNRVSKLYA